MTNDPPNVLKLKPIWNNGSCTYAVTYPRSNTEIAEINLFADESGYLREGHIWTPARNGEAIQEFHRKVREAGYKLVFDEDLDGRPFDLQRLCLDGHTRQRLETLANFELYHLGGWTPVQAEGRLDGCYFYFRARGTYWRFELGGNETGTRSPRWWYEEPWPSETGFEAGYMDNEQATSCILKDRVP